MRFVLLTGLAFCGAVLSPLHAAEMQIAEDGMAVVDGERTFIIGLYENPGDDAVLKQAAEAGFNLVRASANTAALDRLEAHGLGAWLNTGMTIDLSADRANREQRLKDMAAEFAGHPALVVWEVPDEALWNCWYSAITWRVSQEPSQQAAAINALEDQELKKRLRVLRDEATSQRGRGEFRACEETADAIWRELGKEPPKPDLNLSNAAERAATMCAGMVDGCQLLRNVDPRHPVWMNHAPRNSIEQLARFNHGADIVGCDIYPVPVYRSGHSDLAERTLAAVGAYTQRMQDAAPGKPVWMVLQGFAWRDIHDVREEDKEVNRRPTFRESRFMAYDTIVRGARGILYWGTHAIEKDSELWADLMKLGRELADLQPVLSAPDAELDLTIQCAETWGSVDRRIHVLPKLVDGKAWFLVVNEWHEPLVYTLDELAGLDGVRYADPVAEREGTVKNGGLELAIRGNGVQVLAPQ